MGASGENAGEERAIIHQLFQRKSVFSRKVAGTEIQEQIVASNVDIVLLIMSLNADFNIRRLEIFSGLGIQGQSPLLS